MLLSGLGIGVLFPAQSLAVQASVPQNHITIAIVMSSFLDHLDKLLASQLEALFFKINSGKRSKPFLILLLRLHDTRWMLSR
jgi:hypothetical protein